MFFPSQKCWIITKMVYFSCQIKVTVLWFDKKNMIYLYSWYPILYFDILHMTIDLVYHWTSLLSISGLALPLAPTPRRKGPSWSWIGVVCCQCQSLLVSVVDIIDIETSESHADVIVYRTPSNTLHYNDYWPPWGSSVHISVQNVRFPTCLYNTSSNGNR